MAVGTLTGGPSVNVLNNISHRALWRYGRWRSHPGIPYAAVVDSLTRANLQTDVLIPSCRRDACS